ncbi:MAG: anti-sigma factor, partial [Verrucomicrobia bacterium]|nr:anti-sigma factor [Verrucomicrobiota bacterium]
TAAFEREAAANPELARLADDLRETAAALAHTAPPVTPPAHLRAAVLETIGAPIPFGVAPRAPATNAHAAAIWLQSAAVAALLILGGWLWTDRQRLLHENEELRAADTLAQIQLRILTATPDRTTPGDAALLWNAARQEGRIETRRLPVPDKGKSYQLWVIDAAQKDHPINAGVVPIDDRGAGELRFHPARPSAHPAAFAISLEPSADPALAPQGPVLFVAQ